MKKQRSIVYLGVLVVLVAIILLTISLKQKNRTNIVVSAEEVHQMIARGEHFISHPDVSKLMHSMSEGYVFIDLRSPEDFENSHLEAAINVPFQKILAEEYTSLLNDSKTKILYASSEARAAEVWILLKQTGIENIFVLKGGLLYWREKMEGKNIFGKAIPDEEKPRYDFKKELADSSSP